MKKLALLFVFVSLFSLQAQDTASVEYTFTIADEFNNSQELIVGKDPFGSDGLDPQFGEVVVPQVPAGEFGARFMLLPNLNWTTVRDIRFGCYWAEVYTHLIWLRYSNNSTQMTIDWEWGNFQPNFLMNVNFFNAITGTLIQSFDYYSDSSHFIVPSSMASIQMEVLYDGTLSWDEYELLTPNGGDTLHVGETYNISWWSNQLSPFLNLDFSTDVGASWNLIASNLSTSQNNYLWTVPNSISNTCFIRVGNYPCKYDISDNLFVITYPLPVELLSFSSYVADDDITLNWVTATETNNSGFQIERRETQNEKSEKWKTISFVNGNGTTTEPQTYFFKDEKLSAGKYQYRLKQIDFDGTFEYSNTIEVEINPPAKFSLEHNYPNPFNPVTTIRYSIPNVTQSGVEGSRVQIKVFDVLGNEVATLVNEYKPAGNYEVEFDANKLSSGVYYYQLKTGKLIQTKKMTILK